MSAVKTGMILASAASDSGNDVDFMIHGLKKLNVFGQEVYITTTHVCLFIVVVILIVFALLVRRAFNNATDVPGTLQNIGEIIVEMLDNLVGGIIGKTGGKLANYIITLFMFIVLANLSGLLGLRAPTADYGVTLPLGLITFVLIQTTNLRNNKFGAFTDLFKPLPILFPINLIGEFATPISLSLRLFGNVLSGTVIMALIYGLLPIFLRFGIPACLHIYFDIFSGAIQTYVFCMLTLVFIQQKMAEE